MKENSLSLKFDNVTFGYNKLQEVLSNVTFEINNKEAKKHGHVAAIMGESGAGKSTILKLILGIESGYIGTITTTPITPTISYVPQEAILFEHLTPLQNARYFENVSNYKSKFDLNLFESLVATLDLKNVLQSKSVLELSGGQRQRLSLLRALSIRPDFLLLDEPCTGLDAEVKLQFLYKLRQLIQEFDLFVLYITHHQDEARIIANDVIYLTKDEKTNCVSKVIKGEIRDFVHQTPTLEAAKVFHFPDLNIIPIKVEENKIYPTKENLTSNSITLKSENISFNNEAGFEFKVISSSPMFTQIKLNGSKILLIVDKQNIHEFKYCCFDGDCNEYNSTGFFLGKLKIAKNKITY